ncbi:MAG: hypothetical protein ACLTQI_09835 [Slackia sp.]
MIGPKIGVVRQHRPSAHHLGYPREAGGSERLQYTDPGMGYPAWKLAAVNRCKDRMIATFRIAAHIAAAIHFDPLW